MGQHDCIESLKKFKKEIMNEKDNPAVQMRLLFDENQRLKNEKEVLVQKLDSMEEQN